MSLVATGVVGSKLDAHEEETQLDVLMLVGVENVGVVLLNEEVGDGGNETFAVGAVDEKNGSLGHSAELIRAFFRLHVEVNALGEWDGHSECSDCAGPPGRLG